MAGPPSTVAVRTTVNGRAHDLTVDPEALLIDVLRDSLGLTGTKLGCAIGICGACSVLVDGELLSACLILAVAVHDRTVTTIEGIAADDGTLSAVQHAFMVHGGFQCGICTPGQVIAATALLSESPAPDEDSVREWMCGNLCRCTGYESIVESVLAAAAATSSNAS
jgi:aerobic-type carbon monoxide dehydrogenase small subunit (CoxS/CutS family)